MNDYLHAFPGQETHEPIYVFSRPYPVSFLSTAAVFLVLFIASLLGQLGVTSGALGITDISQVNAIILFLGAFQLFILTVFVSAVLDFYYDIVIVTDRRVVSIDQEMLFSRKISMLSLEDVEDVTSTIQGMLSTIFEYGFVQVQTAGARDEFNMDNVRYPREITAIVQDLSDQAKKGVPVSQRIPHTDVIAVINNQRLTEVDQLDDLHAILPDDYRLVPRNAPQPVPVQPAP